MFTRIKTFIESNLEFVYLFMMATFLHFIAANAYAKWCTPSTFFGFLISPFMTVTPVCSGLRWSITIFGDYLSSFWTTLILWISASMIKMFKSKTD